MEDFNSKYTGEQVEALLDIVSQGGSSGGGGGTITEADIANMGFTKNQGTITEVKMNGVSKGTSGVINLGDVPTKDVVDGLLDWQSGADEDIANLYSDKQNIITDLAAIREGASKGATAVQMLQYGEMGCIQTQGFEGSLSGKLYALPSEDTGDEDDILLSKKSVKTINGESIFGSGNITIEGGGSSSGGGKEIVLKVGIYFDDADPVQPNKIYITSISSTSSFIEAFQEVSDYDEYCIIFKYPEYFYLLESVKFANGQIPTIDYDTECELSVVGIGSGANRTYHAVLTPFKPVE